MKAVKAAQDGKAECVIGLGGGSSMDVAKLVALLAKGRENLDEFTVWASRRDRDCR